MTPRQKSEVRRLASETLVYSVLVAAFCLGTIGLLGRPLQMLYRQHRLGYACVALLLMIIQGLVLERLSLLICSYFRRTRKAAP
jgi:hypothetical protein